MNRPKPSKNAIAALVAHVVCALPDSLHQRRSLLTTLDSLLPDTAPQRPDLIRMIEALDLHEETQLKFSALLSGDGN